MKIWMGESDGSSFFLSVPTDSEEYFLSFDWTYKGHRIVLQRRTAIGLEPPVGRQPDGEWNELVIERGRLIGKEREVWYDYDQNDVINGENWLTVKEWPLDETVACRMREIAHAVNEQQEDLTPLMKDIEELESLCRTEARRVGVTLAS